MESSLDLVCSTSSARRTLSWRWRWQRLLVCNPFPFDHGINVVPREILERLNLTIRPTDLDRFHPGCGSQTEVQTQVILRYVAATAAHFAKLLNTAGADGHARANCGAVALGANQLEQHAVVAVSIHVFEQRRGFADV